MKRRVCIVATFFLFGCILSCDTSNGYDVMMILLEGGAIIVNNGFRYETLFSVLNDVLIGVMRPK